VTALVFGLGSESVSVLGILKGFESAALLVFWKGEEWVQVLAETYQLAT